MISSSVKGALLVLGAYVFWGLHPIYWKQMQTVPAIEIAAHRMIWSFVFFVIVVSIRREGKQLAEKIAGCESKLLMIVPALLIGTNWAMFVWAVNAGLLIETGLGYFICPLVSIFLDVIILKEKLRRPQWVAVGIATSGILAMTILYGQFPWISLYMAGSWGAYGLLRKMSPFSATEGLTLDAALLSIPAIIYLAYLTITGAGLFFSDYPISLLLIGGGITSGLPLLAFVAGARSVRLSLVGVLQYVYPTLILLLGALLYDETLNDVKVVGLGFVWVALIVFSIDGILFSRRRKIELVRASITSDGRQIELEQEV